MHSNHLALQRPIQQLAAMLDVVLRVRVHLMVTAVLPRRILLVMMLIDLLINRR